jgi:very-short-patch-repair endonuclease
MEERKKVHNRLELKSYRKDLRNHLTPAEAELWKHIKDSQLKGKKFRRQHSIKNFIVDFYCPEEKLIIELDGQGHFQLSGEANDAERDSILKSMGFRVLRFENKEVFNRLDSVLEIIQSHFRRID